MTSTIVPLIVILSLCQTFAPQFAARAAQVDEAQVNEEKQQQTADELRQWEDATLSKTTADKGFFAGFYDPSAPRKRWYWIKTEKMTYVIPNYSKGAFVQPWLVLPADGHTKVSVDGKDIHIFDNQGRDRTCKIVKKITNEEVNDKK